MAILENLELMAGWHSTLSYIPMIQGNDYSFIVLVNHMVKCFFVCLFVCLFLVFVSKRK